MPANVRGPGWGEGEEGGVRVFGSFADNFSYFSMKRYVVTPHSEKGSNEGSQKRFAWRNIENYPLPYFFSYKTVFSFQNKSKGLDPSYKMDLDLWDCLVVVGIG